MLYELALIYPGTMSDSEIESAVAELQESLDKQGKVVKVDLWPRRKLAFKIKGNETGVYVFVTAELPASALEDVRNKLTMSGSQLRFLISRVSEKALAAAKEKAPEAKVEKVTAKPEKKAAKIVKAPKTKAKEKAAKAAKAAAPPSPQKTEEERLAELEKKLGEILAE